MLLVDHYQAQILEFDAVLNQSMRSDNELRTTLRNVPTYVALAIVLQRSGQEHDAVSRTFQNLTGGKIMLLRQYFSRRHERHLIAVFDGDNGGLKRHDRLARSNIPLQQTAHGMRLLHIRGDLLQHTLLRGRGMERQYLLNGAPHAVIELKCDSSLGLLLAPFEFKSQLDKEQFVENHPYMGVGAAGLQVGEAFSSVRPVGLPQSFAHRRQVQMGANFGRDRIGQIGVEIFKRPADDAAKPARR